MQLVRDEVLDGWIKEPGDRGGRPSIVFTLSLDGCGDRSSENVGNGEVLSPSPPEREAETQGATGASPSSTPTRWTRLSVRMRTWRKPLRLTGIAIASAVSAEESRMPESGGGGNSMSMAQLRDRKAEPPEMLRGGDGDKTPRTPQKTAVVSPADPQGASPATAAPRPRAAAPLAVEWPAAAADFVLLLAPDDLPEVPFRLNPWTEVRDAGKMLRSLRADIRRGPSGPRAFYGALQADLLVLQRVRPASSGHPAPGGPRRPQEERLAPRTDQKH